MKKIHLFILILLCAHSSMAQKPLPAAIEKNDKAVLLAFKGDSLDKAIQLLSEAIAIDSSYVLAYGNKAKYQEEQGKLVEALHTISAAEKYALNNPYYYMFKGIYLDKNADRDAAHKAYGKSFQLFEEELRKKPEVNVFINYIYAKYFWDGEKLSEEDIESRIPSSFTSVEKKEAMDFIKNISPDSMKEGLTKKKVDNKLDRVNRSMPIQREDGVYFIVDQVAEFPGGISEMHRFIRENFNCPPEYANNNKKDIVTVGFVVTDNGSIQEPIIRKDTSHAVSDEINEEILRVISSMPKWIPAKVKGKNVSMVYNIPITF